jgi:hypothetical protein
MIEGSEIVSNMLYSVDTARGWDLFFDTVRG